ncbi:hypothetical protein [Nocardioides sp.]|uniref:hypothetical protein n=1 Tax=Nocardioides sp. TaxID=35761 RepID=UPI0035AF2EB8
MGTVQITSDHQIFFTLDHRLFPEHWAYSVPDAEEAGLADARDALSTFESLGQRMAGHLSTFDSFEFEERAGRDHARWQEISGLCNGAAQSGFLALTAMCECAGLLGTLPQRFGRHDGLVEARWNSLRLGFTLEGVAQYLVSIGHYLTNIALRVAIDDPLLAARIPAMSRKRVEVLEAAATVGTRDPKGWVFHSQAPALVDWFGGRPRALKPLQISATLYNSRSWSPMARTRNEAFHRLREEFPTRGTLESTQAIRKTHRETHQAIRALGRALPIFVTAVENAAPQIRLEGQSFPLVGVEEVYDVVHGEAIVRERPNTPFRG